MKCMMSSDGTNIVRVSDEEASKLYHNENFKYIANDFKDASFVSKQQEIIEAIDVETINALAQEHLNLAKMHIIVCGDKDKIGPALYDLGYTVNEYVAEDL